MSEISVKVYVPPIYVDDYKTFSEFENSAIIKLLRTNVFLEKSIPKIHLEMLVPINSLHVVLRHDMRTSRKIGTVLKRRYNVDCSLTTYSILEGQVFYVERRYDAYAKFEDCSKALQRRAINWWAKHKKTELRSGYDYNNALVQYLKHLNNRASQRLNSFILKEARNFVKQLLSRGWIQGSFETPQLMTEGYY